MPAKEFWGAVALICGALIALGTVVVKAGKVVWAMFEVMRKAHEFLAEALGDKEKGQPSMMELLHSNTAELEQIKVAHAEHMRRFHGEGPLTVIPARRRR